MRRPKVDPATGEVLVPKEEHPVVIPPTSQDELDKLLLKGAAQALQSATTSKDYVEATKVGIAVREALYGAQKEDGWGSGLPQAHRNGAPV